MKKNGMFKTMGSVRGVLPFYLFLLPAEVVRKTTMQRVRLRLPRQPCLPNRVVHCCLSM